jgi:hypothetical protein
MVNMATIAENLQMIKDSTEAIKQAIIDKGGTIEGDITTWANSISGISGGGNELKKFTLSHTEFVFEDGMTWADFVNSVYNIKHFIPYSYSSGKILISEDRVCDGLNDIPISVSSDLYTPVNVTDKIMPNATYYPYAGGGGGAN